MNKQKSILLLIMGFGLCLFVAGAQAQSSAVITVGNNSGYKQATVVVPVDFSPALDKEGVSALSFHLKYNPAELKFKEVKAGPAALNAGKNVQANDKGDGIVRFVVFGLNNTVIAKGVLAEVSFDILASAVIENTALTLSNYSASTPSASAAPLVASNGYIAIKDTIVALSSESQMEENKIVPQESKKEVVAQLPASKSAVLSGQTIIVAPEYKAAAGQGAGQKFPVSAANNREMLPSLEVTQQYEQQEGRIFPPSGTAIAESSKNIMPEVKGMAKPIIGESSLGQAGQIKAVKNKAEPEVVITVKPVKRLFIWRSYKLELTNGVQIPPKSWELSKKQQLPFLLALDKKNGSIFGIVWGKGEYDLKLDITTKDKRFTDVPCKLKIE